MTNLRELSSKAHRIALDNNEWKGRQAQNLANAVLPVINSLTEVVAKEKLGYLNSVSESIRTITEFEMSLAEAIIKILDIAGANQLDLDEAVNKLLHYKECADRR